LSNEPGILSYLIFYLFGLRPEVHLYGYEYSGGKIEKNTEKGGGPIYCKE
jgi:hypothetical protein